MDPLFDDSSCVCLTCIPPSQTLEDFLRDDFASIFRNESADADDENDDFHDTSDQFEYSDEDSEDGVDNFEDADEFEPAEDSIFDQNDDINDISDSELTQLSFDTDVLANGHSDSEDILENYQSDNEEFFDFLFSNVHLHDMDFMLTLFIQNLDIADARVQNEEHLVDEARGREHCQCLVQNKTSAEIFDVVLSENLTTYFSKLSDGSLQDFQNKLNEFGEDFSRKFEPCKQHYLQFMRQFLSVVEFALKGKLNADGKVMTSTPICNRKFSPPQPDQDLHSSNSSEGSKPWGLCVICYDKARECTFIPCGHVACCQKCANSNQLEKRCPTCRAYIERVQFLYVV